jgi:hypothetical protein
MNLNEKKQMRNEYMDISNALFEAKTFTEFCEILKLTLPFLAKYPDAFLCQCLIDDVEINETRLKK